MLLKACRMIMVLTVVTLVVTGCQGVSFSLGKATPQPTPTALLLAPQEKSIQLAPAPTATATPALTETTTPQPPEPTPTSTATPAGVSAQKQPTSVSIMALGIRQSITLRSLPMPTAPVVATVPGSQVLWAQARSVDSQWLRVTYTVPATEGAGARVTAWAASQDLKLFSKADSLPTVTLAEARVEQETTTPETELTQSPSETGLTWNGRVLADRLNVRGGPGLDQPVLGKLATGEAVTVVGRSDAGDWLAIAWQNGVAWVATRYVKLSGALANLPALAPDTNKVSNSPRSGIPARVPSLTGQVAFQTAIGGDIYIVNADGSDLRRVTTGMDPAFSPDGNRLAFARWESPQGIFVLDLRTEQEQEIATTNRPRSPTWSPDGTKLSFSHVTRSYSCLRTPFGCRSREALRALFGGRDCMETSHGRLCISDFPEVNIEEDGLAQVTLADKSWLDLPAGTNVQSPQWHPLRDEVLYRDEEGLQITAPNGAPHPLVNNPDISSPTWSPDGQRIAVQTYLHDHTDIFILDAAGNVMQRLTEPPPIYERERAPNNVSPTWSPDGQYILFLSDRDGAWRLYLMHADGSDQIPFLPDVLGNLTFHYNFAAERVTSWGRQ